MARLVLLAWLAATPASAQAFFEGFETGTSAWIIDAPITGISAMASRPSAHRGAQGLRVSDTETANVSRQGTTLRRPITLNGPAAYTRSWVRVQNAGTAGQTVFLAVSWLQGANDKAAVFWWLDGNGLVAGTEQQGPTGPAGTLTERASTVDGGWHLLETASLGVGSDAGVAAFFIDGEQVARFDPVLSRAQVISLSVGSAYAQGPHTWEADFDDLGIASEPMAQRLTLEVVKQAPRGSCVEVHVGATTSLPAPDGGRADRLAVRSPVSLSISGADGLFADSACSSSVTTPLLTGSERSVFVLAPDGGTITLRAVDAEGDLLASSAATLEGTLDGTDGGTVTEPPPKPQSYFALGCSSAPGAVVLLLAVLLARHRR